MPGLDLSQLSSNWKKLQGKIQTEKKPGDGAGVKRKRPDESKRVNGCKKTRLSEGRKPVKGRKMGLSTSKPEENRTMDDTTRHSSLAKKHDLAPEDISAAYGSAPRKHVDEINGGLHPTHKIGKYISLDCEMVGTGPPPHLDHVLARASLVNFHGEQIYDSYVQPPAGIEVKDYRTFVSGIKEGHVAKGYARPFAEVQQDISDLLDGRILVGHALRNDLQVLMLSHPKRDLRDTSRHPKFRVESKGKPPSLRNLAKAELGMEIQTGEHSSIEDARATMMLFRKEKAGFEEENVKHFGRHTRSGRTGPEKVNGGEAAHGDSDEDDEDEDLELLDGEEDADAVAANMPSAKNSASTTKKKRSKKKKRTKRK